jgi:hypothetical protein
MENKIDLNIDNYSISDLERFFGISNIEYTFSDIEKQEYEIREKLLKSGHIDKRFKRDLIEFLKNAKLLLTTKVDNKSSNPTSIPKNFRLDKENYPYSTEIPYSKEGDIIQRPEKPFTYVKTDDFYSGTLNPLSTRIVSKCLTIDTRFRDNIYTTKSSDFILQLPFKINKVVSMQLSSIELPVSFYGISSHYGNHFFFITIYYRDECGNNQEATKQICISDGNYNASDLLEKINCMLCENADIFSKIFVFLDISDNGSGTGKITFKPKNDSCVDYIYSLTLDFSRDFEGNESLVDIRTKLGWNLGFIKPKYLGALNYEADTIIEPAGIRYVYLAIDDFNNSVNNQFVSATNNVVDPNILARISIKGSYFSLVIENDFNIVTEPRQYFGPVDIQRLRIRLLDDYGRILDMNNSNYSFCLNFKVMYDL